MQKIFIHYLMFLSLCAIAGMTHAWKPYCSVEKKNQQMVIAYLGADSSWELKNTDLVKLEEQLGKVNLVNYAFARFAKDEQGNTILQLTSHDIENIQLLRQLKPNIPIMIAVGGWGDRESFKFLENEEQRMIFVDSVKKMLAQYQLDGIDLDWENELLASEEEIAGVAKLLQRLHESISVDGYCVSNAVPATKAYWRHYPHAKLWQPYVNWTTVMAYDHYGTFGPRTEFGAALYEPNRNEDNAYPYPSTSGNRAIKHYYYQGLAAEKLILGIPFYCHSYYVANSSVADNVNEPGLHVPVIDPNISSQISYSDAYSRYGDRLFAYQINYAHKERQAVTFYGLIPVENTSTSRFLSCDGPQAVLGKIDYVEGNNPMTEHAQDRVRLGGVSFWSLQQDLPFSDENSLLRAIYNGFQATR
ncbi:glycoside hydrolase family 18 protein [Legionella brunensis]|uniref:chitinase n=1 Tax=Legionella brunensis TaxID=29422 RepID=A0A0W0SPM5_9GAMM|nr:glycoside hydrolase family 18 protein [Legionella brunensis]KTC85181.1 Chitinase A1 precursor [Legionella brunensis]